MIFLRSVAPPPARRTPAGVRRAETPLPPHDMCHVSPNAMCRNAHMPSDAHMPPAHSVTFAPTQKLASGRCAFGYLGSYTESDARLRESCLIDCLGHVRLGAYQTCVCVIGCLPNTCLCLPNMCLSVAAYQTHVCAKLSQCGLDSVNHVLVPR